MFDEKEEKIMDSGAARNEVTFKWYNLACSFHCKI